MNAVYVGTLLIIAGILANVIMDAEKLLPTASSEVRGETWFKNLHFGVNLVIFSLALIISADAVRALARQPNAVPAAAENPRASTEEAGPGVPAAPPARRDYPASDFFGSYVAFIACALLLNIVIWLFFARPKSFFVTPSPATCANAASEQIPFDLPAFNIWNCWRQRQIWCLVASDAIGIYCVRLYCHYVVKYC